MCNADKDEYESDLRRNEQYLTNSENKVWKKKKKIQACLGFEPRWYRCSFLPTEQQANWELSSSISNTPE